jgi:hypothetical protein
MTYRVILIAFKKPLNFGESRDNGVIVFFFMGQSAVRAIFCAVFEKHEIPAAVFAERIERAIAEKAVESGGVYAGMAWESLAVFVCEKSFRQKTGLR